MTDSGDYSALGAERQLAQAMMELFTGLAGVHGTHGEPERDDGPKWSIKKTARTLREPVTAALWQQHLAGNRPLGIVPVREDGTCTWGSIDVDRYDINPLDIVERAAWHPLVPCRSKSGGLHLFLFLAEPQPAGDVQAALGRVAASLDLTGSEVFPKQSIIAPGDAGNWIIVPYFGGDFGGRLKRQAGLKRTGAEMTIDEFVAAAEAARLSSAAFAALAGRRQEAASEMPPCLEKIAAGTEANRNNALLHYGVYAKMAHPDDWEDAVGKFNKTAMRPPLPDEEVASVVRSLRKKDYSYTCHSEPMASLCDRPVCLSRRHGVAAASRPHIDAMRIMGTDPKRYEVTIDGCAVMVTSRELSNFVYFNRCCIDQMRRAFVPVRPAEWIIIVDGALRSAEEVEVPPDIQAGGEFRELLEVFLTDRSRGRTRDDILAGRPWEAEDDEDDAVRNRHWFRLRDLQSFLRHEGAEMRRPEITDQIRKLGGGDRILKIKGRAVACWVVPSAVALAPPELDIPPVPRLVV